MDINQMIVDRQMSLPQAVGMDRKGIPTDQKESDFSTELESAERSAPPTSDGKKEPVERASSAEGSLSQRRPQKMDEAPEEENPSLSQSPISRGPVQSSDGLGQETEDLPLLIGVTQEELDDCGDVLKKLAPTAEGIPQTLLPTKIMIDTELNVAQSMHAMMRSEIASTSLNAASQGAESKQVSSELVSSKLVSTLESGNPIEQAEDGSLLAQMNGEDLQVPDHSMRTAVNLEPKKLDLKSVASSEPRTIPRKSDGSHLKSSLEDLFLTEKMGLERNITIKPVVPDESSAFDSFAPKKERLEDFVSGLFVQSNLKSEISIPLFENKLHKLMATAQGPTSSQHQVSQNLFKDLNLELTRMVQRQSGGEMTLQLRPGDMGHVKVDVAVTGESIRIEMVAEKSASESLIKSQLGELKTQLTQAGFKIDELAVMTQKSSQSQSGFDGSNSGREHQQHSHQQNRKRDPDAIFSSDLKFDEQILGAA